MRTSDIGFTGARWRFFGRHSSGRFVRRAIRSHFVLDSRYPADAPRLVSTAGI